MIQGAEIDYVDYAQRMRGELSGPDMCNKEKGNIINHTYFNTKKGFYWSEKNRQALIEGIAKYDFDFPTIQNEMFRGSKSLIELELRTCLHFGTKDIKSIKESQVKALKREFKSDKK